uniref:(northern house mosquito) hypothetical protein n=1 Tax=Culex pipiens TaxID=7175 RepID=A0A8D8P0I5_CULPI
MSNSLRECNLTVLPEREEKKNNPSSALFVRSEVRSSEESRWEVWQQQQQQKWCRDGSRIFFPQFLFLFRAEGNWCAVCVYVSARGEVVGVGTGVCRRRNGEGVVKKSAEKVVFFLPSSRCCFSDLRGIAFLWFRSVREEEK